MNKSELFSSLNDINFADLEPASIESEIISLFELFTGRTLAPGDPVRIFIDAVTAVIIQQRSLIDITGKQNLLAYATGDNLDHIAALLGVKRLEASHALTTAKFSLSDTLSFNVIIPAGTRITPGNDLFFELKDNAEIPAGSTEITADAVCTVAGSEGNNYAPGQINKIVDVFPYEMAVVNISMSSGGSDTENDENFRERIMLAPESFTTAGSKTAYEYYAKSAHQNICDVAVVTPPDTQPGHVDIYPLLAGGVIPSTDIMNAVLTACSADNVRPDTDYVRVLAPTTVLFDISVDFWIENMYSASAAAISQKVYEAVDEFVIWQKSKLGRDINPSELSRRILNAGAKRCVITSPVFMKLGVTEIACADNCSVRYLGLEGA